MQVPDEVLEYWAERFVAAGGTRNFYQFLNFQLKGMGWNI